MLENLLKVLPFKKAGNGHPMFCVCAECSASIAAKHREADERLKRDWLCGEGCGCAACRLTRQSLVAPNPRSSGGRAGSVQPETCVSCGVTDRMSFSTEADGKKYWACDHCPQLHASDLSQFMGGQPRPVSQRSLKRQP